MTGSWSLIRQFRAGFLSLAIVAIVSIPATGVLAKDAPGVPDGPDTPVSSDTVLPATSGSTPGHYSDASAAAEPGSAATTAEGKTEGATKVSASNAQEKKDRLFVDATFIAVSIILSVIAFILFRSLPKQAKKAGNDSVQ